MKRSVSNFINHRAILLCSAVFLCAPCAALAASADQDASPTASGASPAESAAAQADGNPDEAEIVVTAQKREERLVDVPISISVLSGATLDTTTAIGLSETLRSVPGVAVNETYQGGGSQVVIRGVTAGGASYSGSSPVSYYLDSVAFGLVRTAIAPDLNPYDLQRVEVLRGPQGTLYGASSQNGVVRILTNDPNFSEFEFKARGSISTTGNGGENYRGDLAINIPLVPDKVAVRAVLGYQDFSGWIDRLGKKNVNDVEISNIRVKLAAQPTDTFSVGLSAWRSRANYGGPSISDDNQFRVGDIDEPIETDFDLYSLKLGLDLGSVAVTGNTSHLKYRNDSGLDLTTLVPGLIDLNDLRSKVFSQELLLNSDGAGPWRWTLGGIYRDAKDRQYQAGVQDGILQPAAVTQIYKSKSFAVFGELTREIIEDQLELTGGLRYFEDKVASQDQVRSIEGRAKFDALSPRVVLTWHPVQNSTIYASYAQGFRSGFPQSGLLLSVSPDFPPLGPDTIHNYEVGAKGSLFGGRLNVDAAVYFIDWKDVQQSLTVPVVGTTLASALVNSASASGLGFDLGLSAKLMDGLQMNVNFSTNDLVMDRDVISGGVLLFEKGDRLNISPKYTIGGALDYTFGIGDGGLDGQLSLSGNYTSRMDNRTIVSGAQSIARGDSIFTSRASFSVHSRNNWTATLYADNLTNENGSPVRFPIFREFLPWDTRIRPRTIGLQVEYRY